MSRRHGRGLRRRPEREARRPRSGGRRSRRARGNALPSLGASIPESAGLLETRGLVTRTTAPDDERGATVTITDAGRALLGKVLPGHAEVIEHLLFEPLSHKDAKTLADLLAPVRDHMRSTPPRSAMPRRRRT